MTHDDAVAHTILPPTATITRAWNSSANVRKPLALPSEDHISSPRHIQIGFQKTETICPPIDVDRVQASSVLTTNGSFIYTEKLTHLRIVIDTLNPIPRHDNHNFTPQLKHLHLMSLSPNQNATSFTKNNLSAVLVMMAPQLQSLDLCGINAADSTVIHTMMKHVHDLKLILQWDTLETLVQRHKHIICPNIATIQLIFGDATPSLVGLVALWKWATSKCNHCLYCVIMKWTEDFQMVLQTHLGHHLTGRWCGSTLVRLSLLVVEMRDETFDAVVNGRVVQDAWHLFVDHDTRFYMNMATLDFYHTNQCTKTDLQDMIHKINHVHHSTLRIRWKTLEELIEMDETVLMHSIANIHVTFGEPIVFKPIIKNMIAVWKSKAHVTFSDPNDTKPKLTTMVALWKWATSNPGHSLHCVVTDWKHTFVSSSHLEYLLKHQGLIGETADAVPFGLSEFIFEMQDTTFPKMYTGVVLRAWEMFFLDRDVTDVKTNLFDK